MDSAQDPISTTFRDRGPQAVDSSIVPDGASCIEQEIAGWVFSIYTYHPRQEAKPEVLLLFDGMHRNAEQIRNKAIRLAERTGMTLLAPLMDSERFPNWRYARAGVIQKRKIQPPAEWTGPILQALVDWARGLFPCTPARVSLLGHSAGGQLLSRVSAYSPLVHVDEIIIANPSTHAMPVLHERAPYGFKGLFSTEEADRRLRAYLTAPITIYLGKEDKGTRNLSRSTAAIRQGSNRLKRGRFAFRTAQGMAKSLGSPCHWRLVEVPGVAHSSRAMLEAEQLIEILKSKCVTDPPS